MSEVETQYVKRGYWVNIEYGSVKGRTITTDIRTGTVMIALLAILVTLATSHLWNLISFILHQMRADGKSADGLFRQQQALLRTAAAPTSMLADWIKLWWVWRKRTTRALSRSIWQLGLISAFAAATVVAGVFSSYVVDTTNLHVLVHNPNCAPLDTGNGNTFSNGNLASLDYMSKVEARSVPYAQECYQNSTSLPARCRVFVQPNIPLVPERINCPFDSKICIPYDRPGVSVDSGLVDANDIFGWNLQAHQRVKYRRKSACGILKTDGYQTVFDAKLYPFNTRELLPNEQNLAAHYGDRRESGEWSNLTLAQSLVLANVTRSYGTNTVNHWGASERDKTSLFDPIPELQDKEADITLIMILKNQMKYATPVEDPVFSAHKPFLWRGSTTNNMTVYFSDWPNSVMGCKQQYQLCFSRKGSSDFCTILSYLPDNATLENFPGASDVQIAGLQQIIDASSTYTIYNAALKSLNSTSMIAGASGFISKPFPNDQWVTEVVGWERFVWASMQTFISDFAVGYDSQFPSLKDYVRRNLTKGEAELCASQRMVKPGGVMNISVLGLSIVITFTVVIILADLILLKFIIFLNRSREALAPRLDRWIYDGVFQLQRRAYEANDEGSWVRQDKEIPATVDNEHLSEFSTKTGRHCCTHECARKGGDVVHVLGEPKMGIKPSMTVMSDATTVGNGSEDDTSSIKGMSFKELKAKQKSSYDSLDDVCHA